MEQTAASAHSATADLEGLLAMHEQTVNAQAERLELIVQGSQIGTWDWDVPAGASRSTNAGPACSGIISTNSNRMCAHGKTSYTRRHARRHGSGLCPPSWRHADLLQRASPSIEIRRLALGLRQWAVVERDTSGAPLRATGLQLDISNRKSSKRNRPAHSEPSR